MGDSPDDANEPESRRELQARFEASPWGRRTISVLVVLIVTGSIVWNLPGSDLRGRISDAGRPAVLALGLDQNWGVFAPDARREVLDVRAVIHYADGSTWTWRPIGRGPVLGAYRDYRWHKWMEEVVLDARRDLWESSARWIATRAHGDGRTPVRVTLLRRWRVLGPPGQGPPGPWRERTFYSLELAA